MQESSSQHITAIIYKYTRNHISSSPTVRISNQQQLRFYPKDHSQILGHWCCIHVERIVWRNPVWRWFRQDAWRWRTAELGSCVRNRFFPSAIAPCPCSTWNRSSSRNGLEIRINGESSRSLDVFFFWTFVRLETRSLFRTILVVDRFVLVRRTVVVSSCWWRIERHSLHFFANAVSESFLRFL